MATSDWEEAKDRVREAADIVQVIGEHVQLRRAGANFTGLCPFHGEKTPSFSVNPQRQTYKCFGCGEGGDVFAFLMKFQNLTFPEALKELAGRYQIGLPEPKASEAEQEWRRQRDLLHEINQAAAGIYHEYLLRAPQAEPARQYLHRRGVPAEFIDTYQLGCAPPQWNFLASRLAAEFPAEAVAQAGLICRNQQGGWFDRFRNRIMFPILDGSGKVCAFGGRILGEGDPKYMNSPESPVFEKGCVLFGLHQHREAIRKSRKVIVVEGNFDLLLLDVHGISNTVAPLGTALTREHVKALRRCCDEAVLLFDGDSAGLKAARRSVPLFLNEGLEVKVALLQNGLDPDLLVRERGPAAVLELTDRAVPLAEFIFDALAQEHGLTLIGKNRIMAELTDLVKQTPDRAQRELMAAHFAGKLGVSPELFLTGPEQTKQVVRTIRQPMQPTERTAETAEAAPPPLLPGKQRQLLEFLVFYPEFFNELHSGGLEGYARRCAPPVQAVIAAMGQLAATGPVVPEQLLAMLPEGLARQHVAELLLGGAEVKPDDEEARVCCAELLTWLRSAKRQYDGAELLMLLAQEVGNNFSVPTAKELLAVRKEAAGESLS